MNTDPLQHVEWYHSKFRHTYHPDAFPEMINDHRVLCTLIRHYDCRTVCEIGTWNGDTALMLWTYPLVRRLKCYDIHKDLGVDFKQENHKLRSKEEYGKMFANTYVELVFADTMKMVRGCEQHDLVFIDACHEFKNVLNDYELAMSWNPKVIAFHDYHNGNDGVDKAIDYLIQAGIKILQFKDSCIVAIQL